MTTHTRNDLRHVRVATNRLVAWLATHDSVDLAAADVRLLHEFLTELSTRVVTAARELWDLPKLSSDLLAARDELEAHLIAAADLDRIRLSGRASEMLLRGAHRVGNDLHDILAGTDELGHLSPTACFDSEAS